MAILEILGAAAGTASFAYQVIKDYSTRSSLFRKQYLFPWKQSASLDPEIFFEGRFKYYADYYSPRDEDREIEDAIINQKNVLIRGRPLAGKSRAVFEVLKKLEERCFVIKPRAVDIEIDKFKLPALPGNMKRVLFLDDLHIFAEKENFDYLFEVARKNNLIIVATCRSGFEFELLEHKLPHNLTIESIFDKVVTYDQVPKSQAQLIASELDINWNEAEFDGTIGSLIMKLGPMKTRYKDLPQNEKDILRILRRLYCAGIPEEGQLFFVDTIHTFAKAKGIINNTNDLNRLLESLISKEFIGNPMENVYRVEEIYLEKVFDFGVKTQRISILKDVITTFSGKPNVLFKTAVKSYSLGLVKLKKSAYMKVAITAYEEALKVYTFNKFPMDYAMIQNNLGAAYNHLADIEDKKNNLKKAIKAYGEALKVCIFDEFPIQYATTQNNLGTVYKNLADIENKKNNLKKAIKAYEEALKVFTLNEFPIQYAITQNNLGTVYVNLADPEYMRSNIYKAIKAYEEALKVCIFDEFPVQYAGIQNNLGTAYGNLANLENRKSNLKTAIKAYEEALKIRKLGEFPLDYAITQSNLGAIYNDLADEEEEKNNLKKAINACEEALKVFTFDDFPMQYAMTQNNLGNAYRDLADIEDKKNNLEKAIKACDEALKVYTFDEFPMDYAKTQNNMGIAYGNMEDSENKKNNLEKAIKACDEALKVYTFDEFPMDYVMTQNNLGNVYRNLANVEDKKNNLKNAIRAYEEALKIYTFDGFPMNYAGTQNNLGNAYSVLADIEYRESNLDKAIKAYDEALRFFTPEQYPRQFDEISINFTKLLSKYFKF